MSVTARMMCATPVSGCGTGRVSHLGRETAVGVTVAVDVSVPAIVTPASAVLVAATSGSGASRVLATISYLPENMPL